MKVTLAKALRKTMTVAERRIWMRLRARQILGAKFRRQAPIGPFVVDFVCLSHRLIVEIDGRQHMRNPHDQERDEWLRSRGFRVIRFWNNQALSETDGVVLAIGHALRQQVETPPPPRGEG